MDLSIIIPTYNRNQSVIECLLALDHHNAEIIVVDDGSQVPVVAPDNVLLLRHNRNRGRAAAVNTGLRAAKYELVLIIDDDVFASPDMVTRLVDEFAIRRNYKLALVGRVVWDPDVPLTLTMRWMEESGPFRDISSDHSGPLPNLSTGCTVLWRPFVLEHGGLDEGFTHYGLEDIELGLRLKQHGLEVRLLASAVGYHHKSMKVRDLIHRELEEGLSAVYLHSKFPQHILQVEDLDALLRNEKQGRQAEEAVDELRLLEQAEVTNLPSGASDLFLLVYRHHFLRGVLDGLREIGGARQQKRGSGTLAIYNQASHLETTGEFDESRRLFRLVLHRGDQEFWAGAEYHLGHIETELGNPHEAYHHFVECLRLNPGHRKARLALNKPTVFREERSNVFQHINASAGSKVLFILFGELADIIQGFPVVAALRARRQSANIVWLTLPEYAPLVRASFADAVRESTPRGVIPWDWIESEGFTHVFYPEVDSNHDEWEQSGLHSIDFMADKCGVELESHRAFLEPGPEATFEAGEFLAKHGLKRGQYLSASHISISSRHWAHSNLAKVAQEIEMPTVVLGAARDPEIGGTISCCGKPFQVMAALIRWSAFYVGPDSGVSWLASTTNTPMGVFMDPERQARYNVGFKDVLRNDKTNVEEWGIHASPRTVIEHVRSLLQPHLTR